MAPRKPFSKAHSESCPKGKVRIEKLGTKDQFWYEPTMCFTNMTIKINDDEAHKRTCLEILSKAMLRDFLELVPDNCHDAEAAEFFITVKAKDDGLH